MDIVHDLDWMPDFADGSVVTIGEFDGVHRGHRVVLSELARRAAVIGCPTVVVTFDRDPEMLTSPESAPQQLVDLTHKLELLASVGVDTTVVLPAEYVAPTSDAGSDPLNDDLILGRMIDEVLIGALHARAVVVGEDFHFGERRRNTIELLDDRSSSSDFEVVRVPVSACQTSDGEVISSKSIRGALDEGDVELAHKMLGRPYELRSVVSGGARRGRTIGFPTANLPASSSTQLPADGVYAGWFWRHDGGRFPAAVNVGKRPTFYDSNETSLVEAHLIGFKGDLYGELARLTFVRHLRGERKFNGVDELVGQLRRDVEDASALLHN